MVKVRFKERDISVTEEKRIVTGLIVSTDFAKQIREYVHIDYFTNSYLGKLATWALNFYDDHEKAPYKHIKDIYDREAAKLKETESELISELLEGLSNLYDDQGQVNVDFYMQTAEEYFRKRELDIHINNISVLKDQDDLEGAEKEIDRFQRVQVSLDEKIYINLGDMEMRERLYRKRDEVQKQFFQFTGDLGKFLGNWKQEDVIGITAPAKKGKSFLLNDIFKHAVMSNIPTLKWGIEMTDTEELERFDKMFCPSVSTESGMYKYPEFDCMKNQTGDCGDRNSGVIVREDEKSPIIEDPDHVICTKCRDTEPWRFIPTTYAKEVHRMQDDRHDIMDGIEKWKDTFTKFARLIVRPKYSLTYDMMMRDLDVLDSRYNFTPKIILLDYVDILKINSDHDDFRLIDEKWELLQKIAGQTKCMVCSPTQANKEGSEAITLKTTDQAGFYGKSRHVNMMLGINQTAAEKRMGIYRVNILDARSQRQNADDFVYVLQDLKAGQINLDSYWPNKNFSF